MQGKESRSHKKVHHTTGRKSFAQIQRDEEKKIGRPPTRVETYKKCFPVENGGETGEIMGTMQALTNELVDPSQDVLARNDVFAVTLDAGKPGRVRMMGHGVSLTDVFEDITSRKACYRMLMETMATTQKLSEKLQLNSTTQMK